MGIIRDDSYDRARLLDAAARARRRGRVQEAIGYYQRVLAVEPRNPELLRRIAPLHAQADEPGRAWDAYRGAADEFLRGGFADKAIGVYREAAAQMPRAPRAWFAIAELEAARTRSVDAKLALLRGRAHFRAHSDASVAAGLLQRALALDPSDFDTRLDLARTQARAEEKARSLACLAEGLMLRPDRIRRIRWEELRTEPSSLRLLAWLTALASAAPVHRSAPHLRYARANSAPERRRVVLATKPGAQQQRAATPPFGESHWPVAALSAPLAR